MSDIETVKLPWTPELKGLVFRRYRGPADIPEIINLRQTAAVADKIDPHSSREALASPSQFQATYARKMVGELNNLYVDYENKLVGYCGISSWEEPEETRVYLNLGWVLPEMRGKGIGTAMLRWTEARSKELAAEDKPGRAILVANASSTTPASIALLQQENYEVMRSFSDMELKDSRKIPAAKLPDGLELRPVTPEHFRSIFNVLADARKDIKNIPAPTEEYYQQYLLDELAGDPTLFKVAWRGDEAVGITLCHIRNGVGTVDEVAVRRSQQRQGIARALVVEALRELAERDIVVSRLYTDAADQKGARSLYDSIGFQEVKLHYFYRKPL